MKFLHNGFIDFYFGEQVAELSIMSINSFCAR